MEQGKQHPTTAEYRNKITGLRVREDFVEAARELMARRKGNWQVVAFDIQHFKIFNAWFGYEKGDILLGRIGAVLRKLEQQEYAVSAYFGGDNFAVVLPNEERLVQNLFQDIKELINEYSNMVGFLPAFGVYTIPEGEIITPYQYDGAKAAVAEAKQNYTDRIVYYDPQQYVKISNNYEFLAVFQKALERGEIRFQLQPFYNISEDTIVGAEALARWIRPDGAVLGLGEHIPFLETNGFITELDKAVWFHVCQWLRSLMDRNITPVPVSINMSRMDVISMDVAAYLYALTELFRIPPRLIKVEVTESAFVADGERMSQTVKNLRSRGFQVFLDDFGSGYSSLNMLDTMAVDLIKLDMAFLGNKSNLSRKGLNILESVLGMTRSMNIPTIVEGVEREEHVALLNKLGTQYCQGFYYAKPMNTDRFEDLLQTPGKINYEGFRKRGSEMFHAREFLNEAIFTDSMLNHILGAVAFYSLHGEDLDIDRYNEPFRKAIGDSGMDTRIRAIQNYVVVQDRPLLYRALEHAKVNSAEGGSCEVRFYKSNGTVFWYHLQFFLLKQEEDVFYFYGQIEDINSQRQESLFFLEALRMQSEITMCMDLEQETIQYVTGENTLHHPDLPFMDLAESMARTSVSRIQTPEDREKFQQFYDPARLRQSYANGIYHETLVIDFKLQDIVEPVEFSTYYIRHSKDDTLKIYAFARRVTCPITKSIQW